MSLALTATLQVVALAGLWIDVGNSCPPSCLRALSPWLPLDYRTSSRSHNVYSVGPKSPTKKVRTHSHTSWLILADGSSDFWRGIRVRSVNEDGLIVQFVIHGDNASKRLRTDS